jgi:hypothetical protein
MNESVPIPSGPKPPLGRLEQVIDLRQCWSDEAREFTPWLAQEDNIELLSETIGLDLEVEGQEQNVGPFRADILCKDTITGHFVLIENQLERTDHLHLGQLLTYAAGLDAVTIVWIAQQFTDEHRAALDWLNGITSTSINFFGLEIELWRIGDSPLAPKFNAVSKPNDWSNTVRESASSVGAVATTSTQQLHLEFWSQFRQYTLDRGSHIRIGKPSTNHWTSVAVGRSHINLSLWNSLRNGRSGVDLYIGGADAKAYFHLIHDRYRNQVETRLGPVEWRELPQGKDSIVRVTQPSTLADRDTWPELDAWLAETIEKWSDVFRPIVKELNAADYRPLADSSTLDTGSVPAELHEDGTDPVR